MTDNENPNPTDDDLAALPAERLVEMLKEKRKAEGAYRTKLREAEAERDSLRGTVTGFQQSALQAAATKAGVAKSALTDLGTHVPLDTVLGDDGLLDASKADDALKALRAERPHMFGNGTPASGADAYGGAADQPRVTDWADLLR